MLNVVTVEVGDYLGRGRDYVERLHDMVRRNLADGLKGRFVVLTDSIERYKGLEGVEARLLPSATPASWWAKMELFSPINFPKGERVLYFDLDTVITGPLDALASYPGHFGLLRDVYRPAGLQSSIMAFEAGTSLVDSIYDEWSRRRPKLVSNAQLWPGGDQEFLEEFWARFLPDRMHVPPHEVWPPDRLQDLYPGLLRSFKVECMHGIPKGTSVVFFHGQPRPHEVTEGWVPDVWKVGGGTALELVMIPNVPQDEILENIRQNRQLVPPGDEFELTDVPHDRLAIIVGGGPSLATQLPMLAALKAGGGVVLATNATEHYLRERHIRPDAHLVCDARREMGLMYCPGGLKLYASMVNPLLVSLALHDKHAQLILWHPLTSGVAELLPKDAPLIGGGSTIGVKAMVLAYGMGFRKFALFGFDSCYANGAHHAYEQKLNDGERVLDVIQGGKAFKCAPWMLQQAEDYKQVATSLVNDGCEISVYGEGLIPWITASFAPSAAQLRCDAILERLNPKEGSITGVEVGVFAGDLSRKLLASRPEMVLHLVDSWTTVHRPDYALSGDFHTTLSQADQDLAHAMTVRAVSFAASRAPIIRMDSLKAAALFPDGTLDFVFIDADHSYEGCAADIAAWLPKVKVGGVLCGHDYENTDFPKFGVRRAVDQLLGTVELGENFTWFKHISERAINHG